MSNSHAYLRESAMLDWKTRMASLNEDAIKLLNDYQNKVNELNDYMKGNVAEGFIRDESATVKGNLAFHNNMKDLDKMLTIVIEQMKDY